MLYPNLGDGTFGSARALPNTFSTSAAAGDFDHDGVREFARTVSVLVGGTAAAQAFFTGEPAVQPEITVISPTSLFRGTAADVTITGSNFSTVVSADFGEGIALSNFQVVSDTQATVRVAVGDDAAAGPHTVRLVDTLGGVGTGTFTALAGGRARIESILPNRARAGDTLDVVVHGDTFLAPADFSLGAGITVNSQTVESESLVRLNISVAELASAGPRDVSVSNGSGLDTRVDAPFTVTPVRSLDVTEERGTLRRGRTLTRTSLRVSGSIAFNAFSPDARFDPSTEPVTVRVGDPAQAFELEIPADIGWTIQGARAVWRTPKGDGGLRVRLVLDFASHTFALRIDRADITLGDPADLLVDFTLGTEPGSTVRRWTPTRNGFVLRGR